MELHGFGLNLCRATHTCCTASFTHVTALSPSALTLKLSQSLKISRGFEQRNHRCIRVNANIRDEKAEEDKVEEKEKDKEDKVLIPVQESQRKKTSINGFWEGVLEETGQIEWPPFQKVLGTTSLVLAVIVGSSVVLLTVNAVLAELSDKIFSGTGVQDTWQQTGIWIFNVPFFHIYHLCHSEQKGLSQLDGFCSRRMSKILHHKVHANADRVDGFESRRFTLPESSSMSIRF